VNGKQAPALKSPDYCSAGILQSSRSGGVWIHTIPERGDGAVVLAALKRGDGRHVHMYLERVGHGALDVNYTPRHEDKHTAFGLHPMRIMATTKSGHREYNGVIVIQVLVGVGQQNRNPGKVTVQGVLA